MPKCSKCGYSHPDLRRQLEAMRVLAECDFVTEQAANRLNITVHTLKAHMDKLRKYLGKPTTPAAYLEALDRGLIERKGKQ